MNIGDKFGYWVILSDIPKTLTKSRSKHYLCRCNNCNKTERYVNSSDLLKERTMRCNSCSQYTGYKELSGYYISCVKKGARTRNIEFNISTEYLYSLLVEQNFKCALSGLDIKIDKYYYKDRSTQNASIDRIDSTKGYVVGNIQWVHADVNIIKNKYKQDYFITLCKLISDKYEEKN